jgi:hypothetical protein
MFLRKGELFQPVSIYINMFLYDFLSFCLSLVYAFYVVHYSPALCLLRSPITTSAIKVTNRINRAANEKRSTMQSFVLTGKAKTVFRLIELKAKQEVAERKKDSKKK